MTKQKNTEPQELADSALDDATGGTNLRDAQVKTETFFFDRDGNLTKTAPLGFGGSTVNRLSPDQAKTTTVFGEEVDDDTIVPTTFRTS